MKIYSLIIIALCHYCSCSKKQSESEVLEVSEDCSVSNIMYEFNLLDRFITDMTTRYDIRDTLAIFLTDTVSFTSDVLAKLRMNYLASQLYDCVEKKYSHILIYTAFAKYPLKSEKLYSKIDFETNSNLFKKSTYLKKITEYLISTITSDDMGKLNILIETINDHDKNYNERDVIAVMEGFARECELNETTYYKDRMRALGFMTRGVTPQKLPIINYVLTTCGQDSITNSDVKYFKLFKKQILKE